MDKPERRRSKRKGETRRETVTWLITKLWDQRSIYVHQMTGRDGWQNDWDPGAITGCHSVKHRHPRDCSNFTYWHTLPDLAAHTVGRSGSIDQLNSFDQLLFYFFFCHSPFHDPSPAPYTYTLVFGRTDFHGRSAADPRAPLLRRYTERENRA